MPWFALLLLMPTNLAVLTADTSTVPLVDEKEVWMTALADCESGGSTTIRVWDSNNRWSIGKYQYQYLTWTKYSKLFGTTRENITDGDLQDKVTRYILDHGGEDNWYTCSRVVEKKLGKWSDLNS